MLSLALLYLTNDKILTKTVSEYSKNAVTEILNEFSQVWLEFAEVKRMKEEDEETMYKFRYKSHCMDMNEEETNEQRFKELFPSFHSEFHDLIPKQSLEDDDDPSPSETTADEGTPSAQSDDMQFVDVPSIFVAVKGLFDAQVELSDDKIIQVVMKSQRETMLLSSLPVARCGA